MKDSFSECIKLNTPKEKQATDLNRPKRKYKWPLNIAKVSQPQ